MSSKKKTGSKQDTLIVGIGASADGLDALKVFFDSLPDQTGMAFIVVIDLAPEPKINMAELLQMQTAMEVLQVNKKVDITPEHVYVIPPNKLLRVGDNHLELSEPDKKHGLATIDLFFRSLAETKQDHAACIILSGTGSDGTAGMKAVKEHGGLAIVQQPEEAQYPGMPQSAIDSGGPDMVLPVAEIAQKLLRYNQSLSKIDIDTDDEKVSGEILQQIFKEVRTETGHDFSNDIQSSVLRRIKRRMQIMVEEYETSNEELQSVNEELKTVNKQLDGKIAKLDRVNSDLKNLMEASEIGIVFIDRNFCVQRFTSTAADIFNLISSDKGRPLKHVTHNLQYSDLLEDIQEVLSKLKKIKKVVCSKDNRWFIMRMCPYRSIEDKIEGVVLSFVEFTELKGVRQVAQDQSRQEALATLGIYALEKQDLQAIMQRAIDLSCIILDLDCSVIFLLNKDHGTLEIGAHAGCAQQDEPIAIKEEWDIGYAINKNEPTVVMNYEQEDRFAISPFLEGQDVVSSINVVVRGTEDTYGLLGFYKREKRQFGEEEINFIKVVANIIGMTIERKYTKKALQDEVKQSKKYQREILNNNISDRWELGGYLHDNLAQTLVSVKIMIGELQKKLSDDAGDEISRIDKLIDEGISDIRALTHDIIPIDIEEEGVAHAFRLLMRQTQRLHKVHCILEIGAVIHEIKNIQLATNLYHVIQEAVKNAALHGHADNITVSFTKPNDHLLIQIKDDGIGVFHSSDESNGRGLRIMKYRMELLGGTFDIKDLGNSGGKGTVVRCTIPLKYLTTEG